MYLTVIRSMWIVGPARYLLGGKFSANLLPLLLIFDHPDGLSH